ncbi:hypothetical protein ACFLYX_03320 [Chloroflexota bacterium]
MRKILKVLGLAVVMTTILMGTLAVTASADGNKYMEPAPESGDVGVGPGPAPQSGDGIPDGSGF